MRSKTRRLLVYPNFTSGLYTINTMIKQSTIKVLCGFFVLFLFSCQSKDEKKPTIHEKHAATKEKKETPAPQKSKSIGDTEHLFYIDIAKEKTYVNKRIHSIKAKVLVKADRSVEVIQYQVTPADHIVKKINKLLETYRIRQASLDSGKIKTGENIVRLRFVRD